MICRLILADYAKDGIKRPVLEGQFTDLELYEYNNIGYNIYSLPNYPSSYTSGQTVDGSQIDTFEWVFVDFDLKSGTHASKDDFLDVLLEFNSLPTKIVDSGNGIHSYWRITDLDAKSYLRLQRRLLRYFKTDEAIAKIYQLLRVPGTMNVKDPNHPKKCELLGEDPTRMYTCEQLDAALPPITPEDEAYCEQHYNRTYKLESNITVDDAIPLKFANLIHSNTEVKEIWLGNTDDRSKSDYRLGHIMFANSFTKDEALSVLVNSAKALTRAPAHRVNYATNIVDKIWTFEEAPSPSKPELSQNVMEILAKGDDETLKGDRIYGSRYFDGTAHGLRLGHVFGLVAGVGVGKTTVSLNLFKSFIESNPQWHHMFITLEQPATEIAARLKKMFAGNTASYEKIHILSNENEDGSKRDLSLFEIQDYILDFQKRKGIKIACVVLDHIGILKMVTRNGENQGLMDTCRELKGFARSTNTLFIVQSQSTREKAGDGDIELFKGAAYGTQHFESYMDFLMVIWSPLKRCYDDAACPPTMAYKFVKIRFKDKNRDQIVEDQCYRLYYDTESENLRELTQPETESFTFFNNKCINIRKRDKKTDIVPYTSIRWDANNAKSDYDKNTSRA